jgi:hypothetical protein
MSFQLAVETRIAGALPEQAVQILIDKWATILAENVRKAWVISEG